ncbi:MAG: hypothetical protein NUW37_15690 [Planctomycetes bacterium]|nr:hypothetical protein [Planctomycetota bacterium]
MMLLLSIPGLKLVFKTDVSQFKIAFVRQRPLSKIAILLLAGTFALLCFFNAAPQRSNDALMYHLEVPREFVENGKPFAHDANLHQHLHPFFIHQFFVISETFEQTAANLYLPFWLLLLWILSFGVGRLLAGNLGGVIMLSLVGFAPTTIIYCVQIMMDALPLIGSMAFIAVVASALKRRGKVTKGTFFDIGITAGFIIAAKTNAIAFIPLIFIVTVCVGARYFDRAGISNRQLIFSLAKLLAIPFLIAFIIGGHWYIFNSYKVGTLFYKKLYGNYHLSVSYEDKGMIWKREDAKKYVRDTTEFKNLYDAQRRSTLLDGGMYFASIFIGENVERFHSDVRGLLDGNTRSDSISKLIDRIKSSWGLAAVMGILALFILPMNSRHRWILILSLAFGLITFYAVSHINKPRYAFGLLPLFAIAFALSFDRIKSNSLKKIFLLLIVLQLFLGVGLIGFFCASRARCVLGKETPAEFLESGYHGAAMAEKVIKVLPSISDREKLGFISNYPMLMPRPFVALFHDQGWLPIPGLSVGEFRKWMKFRGLEYLLVDWHDLKGKVTMDLYHHRGPAMYAIALVSRIEAFEREGAIERIDIGDGGWRLYRFVPEE